MSRKSRNRNKGARPPDSPDREIYTANGPVRPLTGELLDTFEALVSGLALLDRSPDLLDYEFSDEELDELETVHEELGGDDDELMDEMAATTALAAAVSLTTRLLARTLLARALGREPVLAQPNASADGPVSPALLAEAGGLLQPGELPERIPMSRAEREEAIAQAADVLHEVGLEEFDDSCELIEDRDGTFGLGSRRLPAPSAHVALLESLFARAEAVIPSNPLLAAERLASRWEFSRWSAPVTAGKLPLEIATFSQGVREQEYSLARRSTVALGGSLIGEIATDTVFAEMFPRQRRMAEALMTSFVGVFECIARDGHDAIFRSVRDGQTFNVHEHMLGTAYQAGWMCIGRLIPLEETLFVRSPGMLFSAPPIEPFATSAAAAFDSLCARLSPELALEAVIASRVIGVLVPRDVKPAASRSAARDLLAQLLVLMVDAPEPDKTLDDFFVALGEQADSGSEVRPLPKRSKHKKSKQKSKRRR